MPTVIVVGMQPVTEFAQSSKKHFIANDKTSKYRFFLVGKDSSTWETLEETRKDLVENLIRGATSGKEEESGRIQRAATGLGK